MRRHGQAVRIGEQMLIDKWLAALEQRLQRDALAVKGGSWLASTLRFELLDAREQLLQRISDHAKDKGGIRLVAREAARRRAAAAEAALFWLVPPPTKP